MANCDNLLFARLAVDLRFVPPDVVLPVVCEHLDAANGTFEHALIDATHITPAESARIRQEMGRLMKKYRQDAGRALAAVDADGTFSELLREGSSAMSSHLMPTLQGAPVTGIELTEAIDVGASDDAGRYTNPREFGRGGMGRVLAVHDEYLSREVALKELIPKVTDSGETMIAANTPAESTHLVERFLREARITGNLEHPSIVPVYELGRRPDGTHYYTMKLVRGKTLYRAIRDARALPDRLKLLPHVVNLCQAIAYAHSKGVIHRDIKPANVMVGSFGETVVLDWGLARVLNKDDPYARDLGVLDGGRTEPPDAAHTMAGVPVGTPHYMSPEQADGRLDDVGTRSDVYALGVVLYEVLTGKTPFVGENARAVMKQVRTRRPIAVAVHEPKIPPVLARICAKAMERRPEDRYGSAAELAEELTRFTTGALVRSYDYNPWELLRHYYQQHRALCNTAIGAAAIVLVVAVTSYIYILDANRRERVQRQAAEVARYEAEGEAYRANIQLAANDVKNESFQKARERLLEQPVDQRNWEWGLLFEQCHQDLATATAHTSPVHHLIPAPESARLISIGMDGEVFVWATPYLELLHQFDLPRLPGMAVALSPAEDRLVISRMDGVVGLYDFNDYALIRSFEKPTDSFNSMAFSGDGARLAAGSNDGHLFVWNVADGGLVRQFKGHDAVAYVFGLGRDGNLLLSADDAGRTVVWDLQRGVPREEFTGSRPTLSADGSTIAVGNETSLRVWDFATGEVRLERAFDGIPQGVSALSPDGRYLATRDAENLLRILETDSGTVRQSFALKEAARVLLFSPDGERIVLGALPNSVEVRNVADASVARLLQGHSNSVKNAQFSSDGKTLFTCAGDTEVKAWQLPETQEAVAGDASQRIVDLAWSEPAGLLVAGAMGGVVQFLDKDLTPVRTLASFDPFAYPRVAIHPQGDRAALALGARTVFEVSVPDGALLAQWTEPQGSISAMEYSTDGAAVAGASSDRSVYIWDSGDTDARLRFTEHRSPVTALAFLPDNRRIATGDRSGTLLVWDWHTGSVEHEVEFAKTALTALDVSTFGKVACGLKDGSILLVTDAGASPVSILGHGGSIADLEFSIDGKRLVSLSDGGEIKLWHVETGSELLSLENPGSLVASLATGRDTIYAAAGYPVSGVETFRAVSSSIRQSDEDTRTLLVEYKQNRTMPLHHAAHEEDDVLVFTPRTAKELFELIDAESPATSGLYEEPISNPLISLGLRPSDNVVAVNGVSCRDRVALQAALLTASTSPDDLTLEIFRDESAIRLHLRHVPVAMRSLTLHMTRDEAMGTLSDIIDRLRVYEGFILEYSQRSSELAGADVRGAKALDGLWIPPVTNTGDADALAVLGLAPGDRIVAIDGQRITDYVDLMQLVERAVTAVQVGQTGTTNLDVERDPYQRVALVVSVK